MFDEFEAGTFFERDIHDGDVGLLGADALNGVGRILSLAANDEVRLLMNQVGQPFAHERMIIYEKDFYF